MVPRTADCPKVPRRQISGGREGDRRRRTDRGGAMDGMTGSSFHDEIGDKIRTARGSLESARDPPGTTTSSGSSSASLEELERLAAAHGLVIDGAARLSRAGRTGLARAQPAPASSSAARSSVSSGSRRRDQEPLASAHRRPGPPPRLPPRAPPARPRRCPRRAPPARSRRRPGPSRASTGRSPPSRPRLMSRTAADQPGQHGRLRAALLAE